MMTPDELRALGHKPLTPMRAIRAHCLDCCAFSAQEVRLCAAVKCPSWPYRMGKNPWRAKPSAERSAQMREQGRQLAELRPSRASGAGRTGMKENTHDEPT